MNKINRAAQISVSLLLLAAAFGCKTTINDPSAAKETITDLTPAGAGKQVYVYRVEKIDGEDQVVRGECPSNAEPFKVRDPDERKTLCPTSKNHPPMPLTVFKSIFQDELDSIIAKVTENLRATNLKIEPLKETMIQNRQYLQRDWRERMGDDFEDLKQILAEYAVILSPGDAKIYLFKVKAPASMEQYVAVLEAIEGLSAGASSDLAGILDQAKGTIEAFGRSVETAEKKAIQDKTTAEKQLEPLVAEAAALGEELNHHQQMLLDLDKAMRILSLGVPVEISSDNESFPEVRPFVQQYKGLFEGQFTCELSCEVSCEYEVTDTVIDPDTFAAKQVVSGRQMVEGYPKTITVSGARAKSLSQAIANGKSSCKVHEEAVRSLNRDYTKFTPTCRSALVGKEMPKCQFSYKVNF